MFEYASYSMCTSYNLQLYVQVKAQILLRKYALKKIWESFLAQGKIQEVLCGTNSTKDLVISQREDYFRKESSLVPKVRMVVSAPITAVMILIQLLISLVSEEPLDGSSPMLKLTATLDWDLSAAVAVT